MSDPSNNHRNDDELVKAHIVQADPVFNTRTTGSISLDRTKTEPTDDQALWVAIRNRAEAISFKRYSRFIDRVLCEEPIDGKTSYDETQSEPDEFGSPDLRERRRELSKRPSIYGMDAYNLLKLATEAFLVTECGIVVEDKTNPKPDPLLLNGSEESRRLGIDLEPDQVLEYVKDQYSKYLERANTNILPYLDRIVEQIVGLDQSSREERLPFCQAMLQHRLSCPSLIELIWSYWHEECYLVQCMNAIALRFQNKRSDHRDPLANLELDPLRPLNNLLWGFIQDEYNRLSVQRRAYEYDHHYGITLYGKAVPKLASADSRTRFIEAFHNLLYRSAMYYREDDDATIVADAFPVLNALREVHLLLAEGAHNQFGDLPWTARREMLLMQWLLARPEVKAFLRGRYMVPYQEPWMGAVDDMKRLQGWSDITVTHFHELGRYGEQILLSIRYGDWIEVNDQEQARNWVRYWRPEIQRYIHAYMAVTGVDLAVELSHMDNAHERFLQPSVHLKRRLDAQQRGRLPAPNVRRRLVSDERRAKALPGARR